MADYKKIDNSGKITVYQQITTTSCAATCAAMCVQKSPETLRDDGFDLEWADWNGIATKYDFTEFKDGSASLAGVLAILENGDAAVAKVNTGASQHWVVVTRFEGDAKAPVANNFICADPWTGKNTALNIAFHYSKIYATKYLR